MSGLRDAMKGGWRPKGKEGGKESWRGDFKGMDQVAGWMGKGSSGDSKDKSDHVSQPLSSLKDPGSFPPPPKHINYHGAAAAPDQTIPDRRGLGTPLSQDQVQSSNTQHQQSVAEEEEEAQKPAPPPVPYRVDTTGLSTDNLPPPPRRADSASPASHSSAPKSKPPKPPPRLPVRNQPPSPSSEPPPAYSPAPVVSHDYINQDASHRLANAGVSVPGFGIGAQNSQSPSNAPVNELQSRFSQMNTDSKSPPPPPPARSSANVSQPGSGSSIQNLRERHADKIETGKQKYGDFRERHADTIDSGKQKYGDFRERHADTIDAGKQRVGDFRERHADTIDSGKQKYGDFRERHADTIDSGKQKLSGVASRFTGSSAAPPPPAKPESGRMDVEPAEPARGSSSVQDFRERHADKIDKGKEKWGGVTSRFSTFVEDRKFSNDANQRIPRPPAARPVAQDSPPDTDLQTQAQRKKPPPPPPKRAEIRAPAVDASGPPPIPHSTKPR